VGGPGFKGPPSGFWEGGGGTKGQGCGATGGNGRGREAPPGGGKPGGGGSRGSSTRGARRASTRRRERRPREPYRRTPGDTGSSRPKERRTGGSALSSFFQHPPQHPPQASSPPQVDVLPNRGSASKRKQQGFFAGDRTGGGGTGGGGATDDRLCKRKRDGLLLEGRRYAGSGDCADGQGGGGGGGEKTTAEKAAARRPIRDTEKKKNPRGHEVTRRGGRATAANRVGGARRLSVCRCRDTGASNQKTKSTQAGASCIVHVPKKTKGKLKYGVFRRGGKNEGRTKKSIGERGGGGGVFPPRTRGRIGQKKKEMRRFFPGKIFTPPPTKHKQKRGRRAGAAEFGGGCKNKSVVKGQAAVR